MKVARTRRGLTAVLAVLASICLVSADAAERAVDASEEAAPLPGDPLPQRPADQPLYIVRQLSVIQERIAYGDPQAFKQREAVAEDIARRLKAHPMEVWEDARNRQALIKFALSGGDPELLRAVAERRMFPEPEIPLAHGTLAYAEHYGKTALQLLKKVDIAELSPSLAGHVVLVKAILMADSDLVETIRLCAQARHLSPGTLVEETALRMGIEAATVLRDKAAFEIAVSRYFRRFNNSVYVSAVIPMAASFIASVDYAAKPEGKKWVQRTIGYLPASRLEQFYSTAAETGIKLGKLATVIHAANKVAENAKSAVPTNLKAFEGAATVLGRDPRRGMALLAEAEADGVPAPVKELIDAARVVAEIVQAPPAPVEMQLADLRAEAASTAKDGKGEPSTDDHGKPPAVERPASVTKALAVLGNVDKLLKDADK